MTSGGEQIDNILKNLESRIIKNHERKSTKSVTEFDRNKACFRILGPLVTASI